MTGLCRVLGAAGLGAFVLVAFTPLASVIARAVREPADPTPTGGIVVLAAGVSADGVLSNASLRRAVQGIRLYRQGLAPVLVLSGEPRTPETRVRTALAEDLGVPAAAILALEGARTTREEAAACRTLLAPRGIRRIVLVTDPLHMERARTVFAREGFQVRAGAADRTLTGRTPEERLDIAQSVAKELLARLYYRVTGSL